MLSYETIEPRTLDLLKALMQEPAFSDMRLVGGTALALQYGHRQSIDLDFFGDFRCEQEETQELLSRYGDFRALMSLTYFEDAEVQPMPKMFDSTTWSDMQNVIISKVRQLQ